MEPPEIAIELLPEVKPSARARRWSRRTRCAAAQARRRAPRPRSAPGRSGRPGRSRPCRSRAHAAGLLEADPGAEQRVVEQALGQRGHGMRSDRSAPARATARMMRLCTPQRQRWRSSAAAISLRLGRGIARRAAPRPRSRCPRGSSRTGRPARRGRPAAAAKADHRGESPSTVVTLFPARLSIARAQENEGSPSISTMQAPHCSVPQPNRLPRSPSSLRKHREQRLGSVALHMNGLAVDDEVISVAHADSSLAPQLASFRLDALGVDELRPVPDFVSSLVLSTGAGAKPV